MALDIDERHLLRLGHGEEELETEKDFSRWAGHYSEMYVLKTISIIHKQDVGWEDFLNFNLHGGNFLWLQNLAFKHSSGCCSLLELHWNILLGIVKMGYSVNCAWPRG